MTPTPRPGEAPRVPKVIWRCPDCGFLTDEEGSSWCPGCGEEKGNEDGDTWQVYYPEGKRYWLYRWGATDVWEVHESELTLPEPPPPGLADIRREVMEVPRDS